MTIAFPESQEVKARSGFAVVDPPLTLFVEYDYVTPSLLGAITAQVEEVFETIRKAALDDEIRSIRLCVVDVHTGHSIEYKFGGWFPRLKFKDGNAELWLPKWTAIVILTGTILVAGREVAGAVGDVGDILRLQLDTSWPDVERTVDTKALFGVASTPPVQDSVRLFYELIDLPSIRRVEINGIEVRRREDEEEDRPRRAPRG